jgi:hypothetical protein
MTQDACSESVRNGRHRRVLVGLLHLGHRKCAANSPSNEPRRLELGAVQARRDSHNVWDTRARELNAQHDLVNLGLRKC